MEIAFLLLLLASIMPFAGVVLLLQGRIFTSGAVLLVWFLIVRSLFG
jgi:hypothetical protein